jgi:electron transfer flavoprotein alpha subunit
MPDALESTAMLAVIPVRAGELPAGAAETAAECGGRALVVGSGTADVDTSGLGDDLRTVELGAFAAARWTQMLTPLLADERVVVLPGSPDGRDLAPRLAHALGRRLLAGAVRVEPARVTVSRQGGLQLHVFDVAEPVVATLQPGVRGIDPHAAQTPAAPPVVVDPDSLGVAPTGDRDASVIAVLPPDVATMDLGEAPRIVGGGAGLDSADRFAQLARIALAVGGSMGATRVITDRGWVSHERQIGTTGVVVDPEVYLSFGVSGAVQHTSGLGTPSHVVSVNTDPHCPMMQMSDLAVVSDANAVLDELEHLLGTTGADG